MRRSVLFQLLPVLVLLLSCFSPAAASGRDDLATAPPSPAAAPVAASAAPMQVIRMRGREWCGERCPEWILAEGTITAATPERFRRLLALIGDAKLPVVLDSPGGDPVAAQAIGRMIRARGLATLVGRARVSGCDPREASCSAGRVVGHPYFGYVEPWGQCSEACLLLLAAGTARAGYWTAEARFTVPREAKAEARIAAYFADMGISPGLMPRLRRSGLPLDREDMLHFGLSTGRQRVEDVTGASICLGPSPAPNCLRRAAPSPPAAVSATNAPRAPSLPARVIIWGAIEDM